MVKERKTKTKRTKNFTFTHNNYVNTDVEDQLPCKYIIYGKEEGENNTPHLQGVVVFKTEKSCKQVHKLLPGCHIEIVKHLQEAIEYCKKEGKFTERGIKPMTQKEKGKKGKEYWDNTLKLAKEGKFSEIDSKVQITHCKQLEYIYNKELANQQLEDTEEQNLWYYGDTGTGKSRKARGDNPNAYLKMCNKWWDHYKLQDVVLIEDFDKNHSVLNHHLKIWSDRYPFLAEHKGGARKIRPKKIIITSNYSPQDIWFEAEQLQPILRRFKVVHFHKPL